MVINRRPTQTNADFFTGQVCLTKDRAFEGNPVQEKEKSSYNLMDVPKRPQK